MFASRKIANDSLGCGAITVYFTVLSPTAMLKITAVLVQSLVCPLITMSFALFNMGLTCERALANNATLQDGEECYRLVEGQT